MMSASDVGPRAVLTVAVPPGGDPIVLAVDRAIPCDLALVERLLWLRLTVQRAGGRLSVERVDGELGELLDLVGVRRWLVS
jgi:hypothetical protein